jgi:hypothetical protein
MFWEILGHQGIRRVGRRLSPAAEFLWTRLVKALQRRQG